MALRTHSGVCHSDMGVMENSWRMLPHPTQAGQVGGHEGVGIVQKMGPATENSNISIGDRVGIKVSKVYERSDRQLILVAVGGFGLWLMCSMSRR
jgi:D-arabinose 1-dehydrogenase-like Zn-dependent alcohol dehydrogenase